MKQLSNIGRILFGIPFGIIGLNHFFMVDFFTGMLTSVIPGAAFTVLLTGVFLIFASISIIAKRFIRIACYLLAALLLVFILTIHVPGLFDESSANVAMMQLLKDTSLMGGAILIATLCDNGTENKKIVEGSEQ